jgi:hypothetical protein
MAENPKVATEKVNTAVPTPHDKVAVLSVRADGTHDQTNPELLDPEAAREYTRRQFTEQAIGAVDGGNVVGPTVIVGKPGDEADEVVPLAEYEPKQDPSIAEREAEHKKVAQAAEKAADAVVDSLSPDKK